MKRSTLWIALTVLVVPCTARAAEKREIVLDAFCILCGPGVVTDSSNDTLRFARSTLVADEVGQTDHHQVETLSDRVWASKVFRVPKEALQEPELFIFGKPKQVDIGGKPLKLEPLASTGWTRAKVPPELWDHGRVVLRGGGQLLIEPVRTSPNRSEQSSQRSTDGGQSWSGTLGGRNPQPGEYLVRLRVRSYAPSGHATGWVMSEPFDLWTGGVIGIASPTRVTAFRNMADVMKGQPDKTQVVPLLRTGSTPTPDEKTWTTWQHLGEDITPSAASASHRWAQLKFELMSSTQATPALPRKITLRFDCEPAPVKGAGEIELSAPPQPPYAAVSPVPFVYQEPSPRLKLLRERYQLDKVIAPGKTEMEQLMLLRHWVRHQWHTAWQGGAASWMPPWDALIILDCKDQADCLTMCTHYAAVFTQCCLALGWTARHCILDHHCVSEVFVHQHNKWVMMDAGNSKERADVGLHFEYLGTPLSALELHTPYRNRKTDGITVHFTPKALADKIAPLCRPEPAEPVRPVKKRKAAVEMGPRPDVIPLTELPKYPVCQIENYRRYAFPGRNNYLDSLLPGELYQGWSSYFYDGYWWVGDSPDNPQLSPEYSKHLGGTRPEDVDWSVNWTRIHLARTMNVGELQVDLETLTPSFARFEMLVKDQWQPTPARFTWKLEAGQNKLRVRSVNKFERTGVEASVQVKRGE